jgi:hypothetical protein
MQNVTATTPKTTIAACRILASIELKTAFFDCATVQPEITSLISMICPGN